MKVFFKVLGITIFVLMLTVVILLTIKSTSFKAPTSPSGTVKKDDLAFIQNKILPTHFKEPAFIALSHFPELIGSHIEFEEEEAKFPLQSRPDLLSLLVPGMERKYIVIISNQSLPVYEPLLLHSLPFEAQVGVLGHELAHIQNYQYKTEWELVIIGIQYLLSKEFRIQFEKETDRVTILHGLAEELLVWRRYYEKLIENNPALEYAFSFYFEDRYMDSGEIQEELKQQ